MWVRGWRRGPVLCSEAPGGCAAALVQRVGSVPGVWLIVQPAGACCRIGRAAVPRLQPVGLACRAAAGLPPQPLFAHCCRPHADRSLWPAETPKVRACCTGKSGSWIVSMSTHRCEMGCRHSRRSGRSRTSAHAAAAGLVAGRWCGAPSCKQPVLESEAENSELHQGARSAGGFPSRT